MRSVKTLLLLSAVALLFAAAGSLTDTITRVIEKSHQHQITLQAGSDINAVKKDEPPVMSGALRSQIDKGTWVMLSACAPAYEYWAERVMRIDDQLVLSVEKVEQIKQSAVALCQ